jgi:hypothetical protein
MRMEKRKVGTESWGTAVFQDKESEKLIMPQRTLIEINGHFFFK